MAIDFVGSTFASFTAQTIARVSQVAATPAFEVRFNAAQNAAIDKLNAKIEELQSSNFGQSKTVLLRAKAVRTEKALELSNLFDAYASSNRETIKDLLDQLGELRALAVPGKEADFDTKKAQVLDTLDKVLTANISGLGAPDGLASLKAQALTTVQGLTTATAIDTADAVIAIDALTVDFTAKLEIVQLNRDAAKTLVSSQTRVLDELNAEITDIETTQRNQEIEEIEKLQEELGRIFGSLSLAFESSTSITDYIAESTILPKELDPGSVVNLFA